ncbi:MAG: hypothetical protein O3B87_01445, partial [bacterium]|nr:hypothetical protein [bacterium]
RLILPYYLYLIALFGTLFIIDPSSLSADMVIKKFLLFQGRDLSWLVVLFIIFIPLFSFLEYAYQKNRMLFKLIGTIALISSIFLLTNTVDVPFRWVMWIPWMVYLIFTLFYAKGLLSHKMVGLLLVLSALTFFVTRGVLIETDHTLTLTENKYPPNIFYLSYGIFWTILLYELHSFLDTRNVIPITVRKSFDFLSTYAYSLFFIHFWYVVILQKVIDYKMLEWWGFFGVVLGASIVTQVAINKTRKLIL